MCNLDDSGHCDPDISRHHVSPLQTLAWQLHRLRRWQLVEITAISAEFCDTFSVLFGHFQIANQETKMRS